ncbi:hypothetical protein ACFYXM_34175 [Streptomyces sp. NPDC002476]|uniref:hypothetical protein n=1 Tax=Streptomyces sp. NPDC002476 TaxID=3364648 RepID=UPI0036BFDE36
MPRRIVAQTMAPKKTNPAARRAQKAARRAARKRSDARPQKTSRLRYLRDLEPPGVFYREWDRPNGTDDEVMTKVADAFGPDSDEAVTMRAMLYY